MLSADYRRTSEMNVTRWVIQETHSDRGGARLVGTVGHGDHDGDGTGAELEEGVGLVDIDRGEDVRAGTRLDQVG